MTPVETLEISIDQLAEAIEGAATITDVREASEYVAGHVPGSVLIPMCQLDDRNPGRLS